MTTIIKAETPNTLLALVPTLLGFTPRPGDLVFVIFDDKRSVAALRIDVLQGPPTPVGHAHAEHVVKQLETASKLQPALKWNRLLPVLYVDGPIVLPELILVGAIRERLSIMGLQCSEGFVQGSEHWVEVVTDQAGSVVDFITPAEGVTFEAARTVEEARAAGDTFTVEDGEVL